MKLNVLLLAGGLTALGACTDSDYELSKIVPEEYHKILYVNNSGKQALTLYETGNDQQYTFSVIKAGSDPSLTAHASVSVMPQTQIDKVYNIPEGTDYSLISEDCYSLETTEIDFASSERYKQVNVFLKPGAVKETLENNPDKIWVLPLLVSSETDSVNAEKNRILLEMEAVLSPTIGFAIENPAEVIQMEYSTLTDFTAEIPFGLNVDNSWDLTCSFSIDNNYVDEYNRSNGTMFSMFPDGSYVLPESMTLSNGNTTDNLEIGIAGNALSPGDYMLPVAITGVSMFEVDAANSVYPLMYRIMGTLLDRTDWTAEATSEEVSGEGAGNGVAGCLLDDDASTYWHSSWVVMAYPPFEIVIDMQKEHTLSQIALTQRGGGYTDTGTGSFLISSDKSGWTEIGQFTMENGNAETQTFGVNAAKGRYLKIKIDTSYRDEYASLSEVYVYGVE